MLNKKVSVSIYRKTYTLMTDDVAQLTASAKAVDDAMSAFGAKKGLSREDCAVMGALSLADENAVIKAQLTAAKGAAARLADAEKREKAVGERAAALEKENAALKGEAMARTAAERRVAELEAKCAELTDKLGAASAAAEKAAAAQKNLDEALKLAAELDEKNRALSEEKTKLEADAAAQRSATQAAGEKLSACEKACAQEKRRADGAEKERGELAKRADSLEKELAALRADRDALTKANAELNKINAQLERANGELGENGSSAAAEKSELEKRVQELEKELSEARSLSGEEQLSAQKKIEELTKACADREELMVRVSQLESENKALKEGAGGAEERVREYDALSAKFGELKAKSDAQAKEIRTLKKTNASLEKQLSEMMEDGQLTL